MDKREARKAYKARITPKGIFAVRAKISGEVWVGASDHLDTAQNGVWFQLRSGSQRNPQLQAAWNEQGEAPSSLRSWKGSTTRRHRCSLGI